MSLPTAIVTNIQRFSVHDGPGLRTTVFFKGCPLSCLWCHNPEAMSFEWEEGSSVYTVQELARIVLRDHLFFGSEGGVTVSGGEPLAQDMAFVAGFLQAVKKSGASTACDTCGDVPWVNFEAVLPYVDVFLYDLKFATEELHVKFTGRSNRRIVENLEKLAGTGKVTLRIPVVGKANDGREMEKILALAKKAAPKAPVEFVPYHEMGSLKWEKRGLRPHRFEVPPREYMEGLRRALAKRR